MFETATTIGPYRIIEELGRGGMGVVYRAQHRETGALAALKTVRLTREGPLQSLRREIHALARIRHPGIVAILEDGVHDRSVRELIGRRLDVLGSEPRQVAEVAAVLGREFEERFLLAVTRLDTVRFMEATKELLTRQVFEESKDGVLRFAHDTIRDVALEGISSGARRALHRAAAEAIEACPDEEQDELLVELAQHWEQAGVVEKALDCYLQAARRAVRRFSYSEADRLYRAYLGLLSEPTQASLMASSELGYEVLYHHARVDEAIRELERAVTTAERLELRLAAAHCQRKLGIVLYETGQMDLGQTRLERALHLYRSLDDRPGEASSLFSLASLAGRRGDWVESLKLNSQALNIYEASGNLHAVGRTLSNMATCHGALGQMKLAEQVTERALPILDSFGDRRQHTFALVHLANAKDLLGRHEEARSLYEQAMTAAREIGDLRAEGYARCNLGDLHAHHGRPALARELYAEALALYRDCGDRRELGESQLHLSYLERQVGNFEEAATLLESVVQLGREVSDRSLLVRAACANGHLALARGTGARDEMERARSLDDTTAIPESECGEWFHRLQRAVEAFEAGRPLFHGESLEDVPEGLRRWLAQTGEL